MTRTALRTCPLCEAMCGLELELDGDRVLKVRGDKKDPLSGGFICPKGARLHDLHADPDRLSRPLIREDGGRQDGELVETTWEAAFARVESLLRPIWKAGGRQAVALYLGNPNVHNLDGAIWGRALIKSLRTPNLFTASTMDQMPKHVSSGLLYGHPDSIPVPDLDRTDLLVILGANPLVSNGSLCTAPDFPGRLRALRHRGGRLVVVDPVRTATAKVADTHLAIRPGTDALWLASLVHAVLELGPPKLARLEAHVDGGQALTEALARFTPEAVAARCDIPAEVTRELAAALRNTERAVVYGRLGTHTTPDGTLAAWLVDVLNLLTGHLDAPGGAMFAQPAHHVSRPRRAWRSGRRHSRVRGLPEVRGEMPVATLADEILTPGEGQVRALLVVAGNPALSAPDSARVQAALADLDALICVEPYLNETARHAAVVLPPPSPLARWHYDLAFTGFSIRNVARLSAPSVSFPDGALQEWEILATLTAIASGFPAATPPSMVGEQVLGMLIGQLTQASDSRLHGADPKALRASLPDGPQPLQALDLLLRAGPYGEGTAFDLSVETLKQAPHGVDLGALQAVLPDRLATPDQRIDLAPTVILEALERAHARVAHEGFVMVGRRHIRSNNSWMHNVPKMVSGRPRCTLQIHPIDADALGLGEQARVRSAVGEVVVAVERSDDLRRGVVSLPHGWGHGQPGTRLRVAAEHAGVNSNLLTDPGPLDPLSGNAALNGIPVEIEAVS